MGRVVFLGLVLILLSLIGGREYFGLFPKIGWIIEALVIILIAVQYFAVNRQNNMRMKELSSIKRQKEELERARVLQNKIFATIDKKNERLSVKSKYRPYMDIGGDFHDIKEITANQWLFYIGDFSGHGISAGMISFFTKLFIENITKETSDIEEIAEKVNRSFVETRGMEGYFLTMLIGTIDLENDIIEYISCGNPIPLRKDRDGRVEKLFNEERNSFILGMIDVITLRKNRIGITAGDEILFYTDGVGETIGEDKLPELMEKSESAIRRAVEKSEPKDDMTYIYIKIK